MCTYLCASTCAWVGVCVCVCDACTTEKYRPVFMYVYLSKVNHIYLIILLQTRNTEAEAAHDCRL